MTMKLPRIITRRRAKWTGLVATICVAAAMIASYWYWPSYTWASALWSNVWRVQIVPGGFEVFRADNYEPLGTYDFIQRYERVLNSQLARPVANPTTTLLLPKYKGWASFPSGMRSVSIPFWMPLVLCAVPTVVLFNRDHKPKPGHCAKCRYDLAGLDGDICPECGAEITATEGSAYRSSPAPLPAQPSSKSRSAASESLETPPTPS